LDELLARGLLIPVPVAAEELKEMLQRTGLVAVCGQSQRKVEARLMIGRVGGDLRLQLGRIRTGACLLGELQGGDHAGDSARLLLVRRHQSDGLLRMSRSPALQMAFREPRQRGYVLTVLLKDGGVYLGRLLEVAGFQRLLGRLQRGSDIGFTLLADQTVDESLHGALGLGAHEAVERTTIAEGVDRG